MKEKENNEELKKIEGEYTKKLLFYEYVIVFEALIAFLIMIIVACYGTVDNVWKIVLIASSIIVLLVAVIFAIKIETEAGYYECKKCHHRHVTRYKNVFWAPHIGRTRYLKCPECGKKSWNRKVLTK